jgi:hypothetical protein
MLPNYYAIALFLSVLIISLEDASAPRDEQSQTAPRLRHARTKPNFSVFNDGVIASRSANVAACTVAC